MLVITNNHKVASSNIAFFIAMLEFFSYNSKKPMVQKFRNVRMCLDVADKKGKKWRIPNTFCFGLHGLLCENAFPSLLEQISQAEAIVSTWEDPTLPKWTTSTWLPEFAKAYAQALLKKPSSACNKNNTIQHAYEKWEKEIQNANLTTEKKEKQRENIRLGVFALEKISS